VVISIKYGGPSPSLIELLCRPYHVIDTVTILHTPLHRNKDVLHQKYIIEGLSLSQIASEILSSKAAVRKGLIDSGIPLRKPHQPHGRQSQVRFGTIRRVGKLIELKHEQRIIQTARDLHDKGLSLREIASTFDTMGIATKCKGKKWHPQMISRILKRDF
jgi:hypothetical protein